MGLGSIVIVFCNAVGKFWNVLLAREVFISGNGSELKNW